MTVDGIAIGPEEAVSVQLDPPNRVATALAGVRVLFNGIAAPMMMTSATQASVIAPLFLDGSTTADVVVQVQDRVSAPYRVPVVAADPALFTADGTGSGPGAIMNEDGTMNSPDNPATPNSVVVLSGAGFGQTNPASVDGGFTPTENPPRLRNVATVTLGGLAAQVVYQGPTPRAIAGLYEFRVRIPANAPSGDLPVKINFGAAASQDGVTVTVLR